MSLKPGTQDKKLGRSSPINEEIPAHSCIAVYERKSGGQKFVHLDTSKFRGQFLILLVLDNNLTDDEARNILEFNENLENFRYILNAHILKAYIFSTRKLNFSRFMNLISCCGTGSLSNRKIRKSLIC